MTTHKCCSDVMLENGTPNNERSTDVPDTSLRSQAGKVSQTQAQQGTQKKPRVLQLRLTTTETQTHNGLVTKRQMPGTHSVSSSDKSRSGDATSVDSVDVDGLWLTSLQSTHERTTARHGHVQKRTTSRIRTRLTQRVTLGKLWDSSQLP